MITLKEMRLLQWEKNGPLIYFSTAIILRVSIASKIIPDILLFMNVVNRTS